METVDAHYHSARSRLSAVAKCVGSRRLKLLSLHGFRTNADILRKQLEASRWSWELRESVEFHCVNAPHPARGPPDAVVRQAFPGERYFEWWNAVEHQDGTVEYQGWPETLGFLERYIQTQGPFDGLFGFSQGGNVVTVLLGLQHSGAALQDVAPFDVSVVVAGMRSRASEHAQALASRIPAKTLHVIGQRDFVKDASEKLLHTFRNPTVVRHAGGHAVPKLEGGILETTKTFFSKARG